MGVKGTCAVNQRDYKLVPPDGGWGYMICVASTIIYSITTMFAGCFGMIYKEFMVEINMDSTSVALLSGVTCMSVAISGYFTRSLLKIMSMRKLALLAAVFYNLGAFCTVFVQTKLLFFICQGIVMCFGMGLLYNMACTILNDYFIEKRLMAISLTQALAAAATMIAPQLVKWSLEEFGFRGTLIFISAVNMEAFVAATLMQPATWHMKKVLLSQYGEEEIKLLIEEKKAKDAIAVTTPTLTITETESSFDAKLGVYNECSKIMDNHHKEKGQSTLFGDLIDVPLLKQYVLSISSTGPAFALFVETFYIMVLPQALYAMGLNKDIVAQAIMLQSLGDLVARVAFVFLSKWLTKIGSHEIYIIGLIVAVISRLGMLGTDNITVMLIFITIMGVSRCSITTLPPLIFSDSYSPQQFSAVMGIFMMAFGLFNLVFGPIIGVVRDITDSYPTVFYIMTSCLGATVLLWCVELCYKRNKHKRQMRKEALKKSPRKSSVKTCGNKKIVYIS